VCRKISKCEWSALPGCLHNVSKSGLYLSFCLPGQHKRWLEEWRNDIHVQGLTTNDIYLLINDWWSSFWITSY
ncbi:hypothetical protein CWM63_29320, partial [Klebsiella sp. F-Nf9]